MTARTSLAVQPHLYIGDSTGRPLDNGKVYFGQADKDPELYPINVFYDEAKTISALQPVTTKGGFMSVNGNMTEIYAEEAIYSVKALDQYGRQVLYKAEMHRNKIGDLLSNEIARAIAADNTLTGSVSTEVLRATAAEASISSNLTSETNRAVSAESALEVKDAALQSQINSVGGGKKAYTTEALMIADKANIPINASVDVTNDPTSTKNGMYAYNGTVFTKSTYDPLTQGKVYTDTVKADTLLKVQNVFATKALMLDSALPDGSNAQVNSDATVSNNGFYKKAAGVWGKSTYDPIAVANDYTDKNTLKTKNFKALDSNLMEVTDARGISTWLQISPTGGITAHSAKAIAEAISYAKPVIIESATNFLALTDASDRVVVSIDSDGYIFSRDSVAVVAGNNSKVDLSTITFHGSSTMWYLQSDIFDAIKNAYPKIVTTAKSYGISASVYSHTLSTIGINQGFIKFTGGQIIPNVLVPLDYSAMPYGLTSVGSHYVYGYLSNGITGRLGGQQFEALNINEAVVIDPDLPIYFTPDNNENSNAVAVVNIGKNNMSGALNMHLNVLQVTREAVQWLDERNDYHTIVIGHFVDRGGDPNEAIEIKRLNAKLRSVYGDRFFDLQGYLLSDGVWVDLGITKTQEDITAITNEEIPPSLSRNASHTSAEIDVQVGYKILTITNNLGWY